MKKYVAYLRVSTSKQERSGLGLDSQKAIIEHYSRLENASIVFVYTESASGKSTENRPLLKEAISMCQEHKYSLIVAKLDRLSRDVGHTFQILKQLNNRLVSCDIPSQYGQLDSFVIAVQAGIAMRERELISIRTKLALAEKKKRGFKLGSPGNLTREAAKKGQEANRQKAIRYITNPILVAFVEKCLKSELKQAEIAVQLNKYGFRTPRGKKFTNVYACKLIRKLRFVPFLAA
ncbi:Site-specific DNA recombinase [Pseudarcicella hirudinis]|uniref:Site-specific DNA recombinase n=1 Tax=Pseudarcicella hirudinis TaxID=1079859 RepID=A0A1I5RXR4_9BACT|nr:recombinase family protein [Pseudarcicella hirudinis]SFP63111.1 Site-specific DNA recombinase [Pseudarcicella hirudinis]